MAISTAQINALDLGARAPDALLDEYGDAIVRRRIGALRARAARLMRAQSRRCRTAAIGEDFLDNDGITRRAAADRARRHDRAARR